MHVESRLLGRPILHGGVLVRGVVVGDQMQGLPLGRLAIDLAEELQRARAATCTGLRCLRASRQTRIARDLEAMNEMRLQAIGAPVCRETLAALTPSSAAILRVLQCVAASAACPHDNPPISPEDAEALKQLNELVEVPG